MAAALMLQTAGFASAQEREIVPLRILEALHMDGVLDEGIWQNALAASGFTQQRPDEGQPATSGPRFGLLYDEQTLYVGVWAYDSDPSRIIATQMARDGVPGRRRLLPDHSGHVHGPAERHSLRHQPRRRPL